MTDKKPDSMKVPTGAPVANGPDSAPTGPDVGQAEVQTIADQEVAQGYRGTKVDPTPDSAYTVAGQIAAQKEGK